MKAAEVERDKFRKEAEENKKRAEAAENDKNEENKRATKAEAEREELRRRAENAERERDEYRRRAERTEVVNAAPPPRPTIQRGVHCRCTGRLHASSYGERPGKTLNNDPVYISRVVEGRPCPILLGNQWTDQLGWVPESSLIF